MRLPSVLLLALAAAPALAAPSSEGAAPVRTLSEFERRIEEVDASLSRLVARAKTDFKLERIRLYRGMTVQELGDPLRGVTADEILRYVADESVPPEIREEGSLAITSDIAKRNDVDLSEEGKGIKRPRAALSMKVTPLLTAKDLHSRSLADTMLKTLWPNVPARDPDINSYDPRKKDTWWEGRRAWEKQLKR